MTTKIRVQDLDRSLVYFWRIENIYFWLENKHVCYIYPNGKVITRHYYQNTSWYYDNTMDISMFRALYL